MEYTVSTFNHRQAELDSKWKRYLYGTGKGIVQDGIPDYAHYVKSCPRILYLLKEANDESNSNWSLRDYILQEDGACQRGYTWNNLYRWTVGIRHLREQWPLERISPPSPKEKLEVFHTIGTINVKKTTGSSSANAKELWASVNDPVCQTLLKEQIELCDPSLIICCGTTQYLRDGIYAGKPLKWKMTANGISYCQYSKERCIVDYMHPGAHKRVKFLYDNLMAALCEIYDI